MIGWMNWSVTQVSFAMAQKIRSVFENARFFHDLSSKHGSVGAYMAASPPEKYVDLLATLKKRGSRLGGTSGQYFLRSMGVPS